MSTAHTCIYTYVTYIGPFYCNTFSRSLATGTCRRFSYCAWVRELSSCNSFGDFTMKGSIICACVPQPSSCVNGTYLQGLIQADILQINMLFWGKHDKFGTKQASTPNTEELNISRRCFINSFKFKTSFEIMRFVCFCQMDQKKSFTKKPVLGPVPKVCCTSLLLYYTFSNMNVFVCFLFCFLRFVCFNAI
jgi:hypothetical protein